MIFHRLLPITVNFIISSYCTLAFRSIERITVAVGLLELGLSSVAEQLIKLIFPPKFPRLLANAFTAFA
jgi:hypothetical protein